MAGPQPNPQQPYGMQQQPQPQQAPPPPRREGSMAPKVWGVILLILGGLGLLMLVGNLISLLGGGIKASTFSVNMSPAAKAQLDHLGQVLMQSAMHRWSFWTNAVLEVLIACVSVVAGFLLVIRPRPKGRSLAIARALIVLAALPIYGYESMTATTQSMDMVAKLQQVQMKDMIDQREKSSPSKNDAERKRRRESVERTVEKMQPVMRGMGYGVVVITVIGILVINGLLLFFMTRPKVKDYMDHVVEENTGQIPGFDPSMGMMGPPPGAAPPPGQGPPHPGQPSPADQPPPPPEQQMPPV